MTDTLIGKTIGKYEIVEHIGRGATADVYKAYQPALDRFVALKLLHPFLSDDPNFLDRFQHEAKSAARLRHPNIVQVFDFDVFQDTYFLVMEFIDGITLKTKLQELHQNHQLLPLDEGLRISRLVAQALLFAHINGLIHRDIKPANIMLDRKQQVYLADFGTAKLLGGAAHTVSGITVGTAAYASPEQVLAQPVDARSDIYSLGVVLFEMVTGQPPYTADTGVAVFLKHLTDPIPSPRVLNRLLPMDVERVIQRAMAKKPENRYQAADALIQDLDRIKAGLPISEPETPALATPPTELNRFAADFELPPAEPAATTTGKFELLPYTLAPGLIVSDPANLPKICDADWNRAVTHFAKGYIANWLREGVNRLRAAYQHGLADELEIIAQRAETIVQRIPPNDDFSRNAALEEFLLSLGATRPILQVTPSLLDLVAAGVGEAGEPIELKISNGGRGYLFGQVVSQVPWLQTKHSWFGCVAGASATILVQPILRGAPPGQLQANGAMLVRSIGGNKELTARITVLPAILQTDVDTVDFGTIGQGDEQEATIEIRNAGKGILTGTIRSLIPWLKVSPFQFRVPAGSSASITVLADALALAPGLIENDQALQIETGDGIKYLGVRMHVELPRLRLDPHEIDFGTIDLIDPKAFKTALVKVSNVGLGVLKGTLAAEADWVKVDPNEFRCERDQSQTIQLTTMQLKTGGLRQVVRIKCNAGEFKLPIRLRVVFSLEPELVNVPAGTFLRGSKGYRDEENVPTNPFAEAFKIILPEDRRPSIDIPPAEQPQREIYLSEYWIGKHPVTNAEYAVFIAATGRRPPEHWGGTTPPAGFENHPVVNVSWFHARAYCNWLSEITGKHYHLPTEAQWEKAARGWDGRMFPWGVRWDKQRCNTAEGRLQRTTPVGLFSPAGDSPYECTDMAGNVWQWTLDWFGKDYYAGSTVTENPTGPANGAVKVIRGGSFNTDAFQARSANRSFANLNLISSEIGFRVVME